MIMINEALPSKQRVINVAYQFCPSCGGQLPAGGMAKFCPDCGVKLSQSDETAVTLYAQAESTAILEWEAANVSTMADVMACCDRFIAEQTGKGLSEEAVRVLAGDLFRLLKTKLPPRKQKPQPIVNPAVQAARVQMTGSDQDRLSVVLKACTDKERLAGRLCGVLRRGVNATRMAVDMAPCVILYKSKADDAQSAIAIFEDEGSAYAVVTGDFEANAPVDRLIEGYHTLNSNAKMLLSATPPALWLGEDIRAIIPDVELDHEEGLLIITGRNLCFLSQPVQASRAQWLVVPYSRIAEIVDHPNPSGGVIEVIYNQFGREDLFRFYDQESFHQAYEEIGRAMESR